MAARKAVIPMFSHFFFRGAMQREETDPGYALLLPISGHRPNAGEGK